MKGVYRLCYTVVSPKAIREMARLIIYGHPYCDYPINTCKRMKDNDDYHICSPKEASALDGMRDMDPRAYCRTPGEGAVEIRVCMNCLHACAIQAWSTMGRRQRV